MAFSNTFNFAKNIYYLEENFGWLEKCFIYQQCHKKKRYTLLLAAKPYLAVCSKSSLYFAVHTSV